MDLDRLDLAILDHLQKDGRATAAELGEAAASRPHRRTGGRNFWKKRA